MRKVKIILIILTFFLLTGCVELSKLDTPSNIVIDKNIITFDKVKNAKKYIININEIEYTIETNSYTIEEEGPFIFKIKAISNLYLDSDYSNEFEIEVKFLNYPENIRIENKKIIYDLISFADGYNIEINGVVYNTVIDDIPELEEGIYEIRIQSISNKYVNSEYSPLYIFEINDNNLIKSNHKYRYSMLSTFDLPLFTYNKLISNYKLLIIDNEELNEVDTNYLNVIGNTIYLKNSYLSSLELNTYEFKLITNLGEHNINLTINNNNAPYIFRDLTIKNNYIDDIIYNLELFDYKLDSVLSSDNITVDDYTIYNNIVTIKQSFITNYFSNSNRNNLLLSILLKNESNDSRLIIVVIER